jgi:ribonuclease E
VNRITVKCNVEVAAYLNNKKRKEIFSIEDDGKLTISILGSESAFPEHLELDCRDADGNAVKLPV